MIAKCIEFNGEIDQSGGLTSDAFRPFRIENLDNHPFTAHRSLQSRFTS